MNAVALMEFLFLVFFKLVPSDLRMNRINFHVLHTAQQGFFKCIADSRNSGNRASIS